MTIGDTANIVMAIATVVSVFYIARQISDTRKQAKGQFLLHLDERMESYKDVHRRLVEAPQSFNPETDKDVKWQDVWSYVGFFERIYVMVDDEILNISLVDRLYGYRIYRIILNDAIYDEIAKYYMNWQDFICICKALIAYKQQTSMDGIDIYFKERVDSLALIPSKNTRERRTG
jgi:hypothetical protein